MHRRFLPIVALLLCAIFAASAQANFKVGMADQNAAMFDSPRFKALKIKRVRYLVPYDWFKIASTTAEVTNFMDRARADRIEVLVHFTAKRGCYANGRYSRGRSCRAPTARTYRKGFLRFRSKFPSAKTFGVWNEANHASQPTFKKPRLAARYYLTARAACRSCKLVAADLLDATNMERWMAGFNSVAKGRGRIFGLHNYGDVNRKRTQGTTRMLRLVPGEVWLTETGGILAFEPAFPRSQRRQANRTKNMFRLANKYDRRASGRRSRITRLYNYQWTGVPRNFGFDAGLVNPNGSARKAYNTFKTLARRYDR